MSVLIIEDDGALSHLMFAVFRRTGLEVVHISRGDDAIEAIDASGDAYQAIILDLMLPVVNGLEILEHIGATRPRLLSRVLVMTAASNAVLEKLKLGPAPRRVIRKPFDLEEFRQAVAECVGDAAETGR